MPVLLSLETSTSVCSAALHEDGKLLASLESKIPQSASSELAVMIDRLFKTTQILPNSINGVIVSAGPGSYTGLRIGVATAKGLCFALNIPLLSVNTLELMTYQVISSLSPSLPRILAGEREAEGEAIEALFCPMLDARRMEVYCLIADQKLNILEQTNAKVIDELSFDLWLKENVIYFFGNGAIKSKSLIIHQNARFIEEVAPSASKLGELGYKKFQLNQFENLSSYEPFYLKDFVAKKPKSV
jgi:tRNA threonylcarbamoyladenosine biosynthesis protein TsaB